MTPDSLDAASARLSLAGGLSETTVSYDRAARQKFGMMAAMVVERGSLADWHALAHMHYKAEKMPLGPTYWRLVLNGEPIGVVILSIPRPLLRGRHALLSTLKPGRDDRTSNTSRYDNVNRYFKVASRVVLDSMWRGCGASYRFLNLACRMSGMRFIELQSAMSKYNQFTDRAGFVTGKPMRSPLFEPGMKLVRSLLTAHPADIEALLEEIATMRPAVAEMTRDRLRRFYWKNSSMEQTGDTSNVKRIEDRQAAIWAKVVAMPDREIVENFQQLVLASPLYSLYRNPDFGRVDMPVSLPLTAFDRQKPDRPLVLD